MANAPLTLLPPPSDNVWRKRRKESWPPLPSSQVVVVAASGFRRRQRFFFFPLLLAAVGVLASAPTTTAAAGKVPTTATTSRGTGSSSTGTSPRRNRSNHVVVHESGGVPGTLQGHSGGFLRNGGGRTGHFFDDNDDDNAKDHIHKKSIIIDDDDAEDIIRRYTGTTPPLSSSGGSTAEEGGGCSLECCHDRLKKNDDEGTIIASSTTAVHNDDNTETIRSLLHDQNILQQHQQQQSERLLEEKGGNETKQQPEQPKQEEEEKKESLMPLWASYLCSFILVAFSALFSGLTLGLMALDKTGLEIVMAGDDPVAASNARKIYPVRKNGNLLLCTLLLGNVAVNALLSILLSDIAGGLVGFLASTGLLVIFGEIIPQAVCSRYALIIGSRAVPLVKIIILLLLPIAYPLSWCLNKALGHELGTIYSKSEMDKLLEIHAERGDGFNTEMASAMKGALKYQDVKVSEVMTPRDKTYMLSVEEKLSYETIVAVFKTGYSRIPVYEGKNKNNIMGLLFVKDLIFVDPEDETPLRSFVRIFSRGLHVVWPDDSLGDVLKELKQGRSHMALVRDVNNENPDHDPFYEIKGIITLEDIIEVIIGDEIVDETDAYVDNLHSIQVKNREFDSDRLRLLDSKLVDKQLTCNERKAVTAFLRANYNDVWSLVSDEQLEEMISTTCVTEIETPGSNDDNKVGGNSGGTGGGATDNYEDEVLYERGTPTDICTLVLSGKVTVLAGNDEFQSDAGAWSVLAKQALTDSAYAPDFTAYVSVGPCRCLKFTRERFVAALDASAGEKIAAVVTTSQRQLQEAKSQRQLQQAKTTATVAAEHPPPPSSPIEAASDEPAVQVVVMEETQNVVTTPLKTSAAVPPPPLLVAEHERTKPIPPPQTPAAGASERKSRRSKLLAAFHSKVTRSQRQEEEEQGVGSSDVGGDDKRNNSVTTDSEGTVPTADQSRASLQMMLTEGGSYVPRPRKSRSSDDFNEKNDSSGSLMNGTTGVDFIAYNGCEDDAGGN